MCRYFTFPCFTFYFLILCSWLLRVVIVVAAAEWRVQGKKEVRKMRGKEGRFKHVLGHVCHDRYAHIVIVNLLPPVLPRHSDWLRWGSLLPLILSLVYRLKNFLPAILLWIVDLFLSTRTWNLTRRAPLCKVLLYSPGCIDTWYYSCNFNAPCFYQKTLRRRRNPNASALSFRLFTNTCLSQMLTRPARSLSHSINNAYMQGFNGDAMVFAFQPLNYKTFALSVTTSRAPFAIDARMCLHILLWKYHGCTVKNTHKQMDKHPHTHTLVLTLNPSTTHSKSPSV